MCCDRNWTFVVLTTSLVIFLLLILGLTAPVHPESFQANLWEEGNKRLPGWTVGLVLKVYCGYQSE